MKLLAQHGFGDGDKCHLGLERNYIDGIIYSPRDIKKEKLIGRLKELNDQKLLKDKIILFDSQFYSLLYSNQPNFSIGNLGSYNFTKYNYRTSDLEIEKNVEEAIRKTLLFQIHREFSFIISPNIIISKRFDSIEGAISKKFIRLCRNVYRKQNDKRPIYCTLSLSYQVLTDHNALFEFLNDITVLKDRPDGFYILVSTTEGVNNIYNYKVIAGWMLLNHILKINGFKTINGYSDLVSPLLACVGADFAATGWFSTLRSFSMKKFMPEQKGGKISIVRYLSKALWNRITHIEFNEWSNQLPEIENDLNSDDLFDLDKITSEPDRKTEVLQHWEALNSLIQEFNSNDVNENLNKCEISISNAINLYQNIYMFFDPDQKSSGNHLEVLLEAISEFRKLAEL